MTIDQITALLTGTVGGLFLSLLLNYAFYQGRILNPKKTVPREDYEAQVEINKKNTAALELLAQRSKRGNADVE